MTDDLTKLRHEVYRSGALFYGAMAKYFTDLNNDVTGLTDTTLTARETGLAYNAALVALLKRLNSMPGNTEISREAERAERAISLLSFEIQRLQDGG